MIAGLWAVLRKETLQMTRDRGTLRMALVVPIFQLVLYGLIDTNVRHVPTVVFDQSRTRQSRELVRSFVNTSTFDVVAHVGSRQELRRRIVAGDAQVGVEIPPDYARRLLDGRGAEVLALIDGSDSSLSAQSLAAVSGLALSRSLTDLERRCRRGPALNVHPVLLFNPDARSANLLLPGLIAILLTFSGSLLSSYAIVRERERGTLEQLMVTPVSPVAVVLGKLVPYLVMAYAQMLLVLLLMTTIFEVPIHGSLLLLLAVSVIYLLALLSLGLLISSVARTQMEATQTAQLFLLPSILLSGYIFPLSSLPAFLLPLSYIMPATHFIAIARAIIVRGAGFAEIWLHVAALLASAVVLVAASSRAFKKTLA
jgi:ABC-2 type transport system permease protein